MIRSNNSNANLALKTDNKTLKIVQLAGKLTCFQKITNSGKESGGRESLQNNMKYSAEYSLYPSLGSSAAKSLGDHQSTRSKKFHPYLCYRKLFC